MYDFDHLSSGRRSCTHQLHAIEATYNRGLKEIYAGRHVPDFDARVLRYGRCLHDEWAVQEFNRVSSAAQRMNRKLAGETVSASRGFKPGELEALLLAA